LSRLKECLPPVFGEFFHPIEVSNKMNEYQGFGIPLTTFFTIFQQTKASV
jgi:hypothetical protein